MNVRGWSSNTLVMHLNAIGPTGRQALAGWLRERAREMRPDRALIREEMGCDLVKIIKELAEHINWVKA